MNKTKLGISTWMSAGILFLLATVTSLGNTAWIFSIPFVMLVAFNMLKEEDKWLKACTIKSVLVIITFAIISILFSFVGDFLDFLNFFLQFADIYITDGWNITGFLVNIVGVFEKVILILLSLAAFKGKTIKFPFVDNCINKHLS